MHRACRITAVVPSTTLAMVLALMLTAAPTQAVKPEHWTHEQPKDFVAGTAKDVVVSSQGEVLLARASKLLHDAENDAEAINALAQSEDGTIYAATGPEGVIYRIDGEDVTKFATLPEGNIFSLLFAKDGRLLAGTGGGENAKIFALNEQGKPSVFFEPKGAKYIWAMARGLDGEIYAATGNEGQLYVIDADGKNGKVLAKVKPKNILCLAFGHDGMLYMGTDEEGLIYRINPDTGKSYVMYDAAEAEISALVTDDEGNIYAATAAADQARPSRAIADKPGGKPEADSKDAAAPTQPAGSQPAAGKDAPKTDQSKDESPKDADKNDAGKEEKTESKPAAIKLKSLASVAQMLASRSLSTTKPTSKGATAGESVTPGSGNAIYRIDPYGFVTEVFRESVMILDLVEADGTIYAATGNEGRVYEISPKQDRKSMIVKLDAAQVTTLLKLDDGTLIAGTANNPKIMQIGAGFAEKGSLTSKPLDAGQIVKWGRIRWEAAVPAGAKLTIATRSGNVSNEESEAWDEWSDEVNATTPQQITSPGARFLQYRLTLETDKADATPRVSRINIARIEENRPPLISSVEALSAIEESKKPAGNPKAKQIAQAASLADSEVPPPQFHFIAKWRAEDPNQDPLTYELFYRQVGSTKWIRLAKELKEAAHIWDTRTVPDSRYELKVTADDRAGNSPITALQDSRISDPFLVDNTPPQVRIERVETIGKRGVRIRGVAIDESGNIAEAAYKVDSEETSHMIMADDDVLDSPEEPFTIVLHDLDPGYHWISIRVTDDHGNSRYVVCTVTTGD